VFLELQEDHVYSCCPAWINDTRIGNYASGKTVLEIWNSPESRAIRESMLDGSLRYCNATLCPRLQNESVLEDVDDILAGRHGSKLQEIFATRQTVAPPPDHINLCYDRSCNLSCPSCRTELVMVRSDHPRYEAKQQLQEQVLEFIHSTRQPIRVSLTGSGDPFASRLFFELLGRIDLEKNPNITLTLQTNGVMFDKAHWDRVPNIHGCRHIDAYISLDAGTEATYLEVRRGGNWTRLMDNLAFVSGLNAQGAVKYVRLDMVVQDCNFHEINDFVRIARRYDFHCILMRLVNWGTYSDAEFERRNVFSEAHPRHEELRRVMRNLIAYDKLDLGNLKELA
jgi:molybdenum cofactor biosynthesis enzyme MoaA